MGLTCNIFGHKWNGCKCDRCGAHRDDEHDWNGCKCRVCGKYRDKGHEWNGCICRVCGKHRDEGHNWDGCVCKRCGKWRDEGHEVKGAVCIKCGVDVTPQCTYCAVPLNEENRMRGIAVAVCIACYEKAQSIGAHKLMSRNYPKQYDIETRCLRCGGTYQCYDEGQSNGMDFKKEPCNTGKRIIGD